MCKTLLLCGLLALIVILKDRSNCMALNDSIENHHKSFRRIFGGSARVAGGEFVNIRKTPYQVQLWIDDVFYCGGALISPNKVLTAAHCVAGNEGKTFEVHAGITRNTERPLIRKVVKHIMHPKYKPLPLLNNDIAILFLDQNLIESDKVKVVALPAQGEEPRLGDKGLASGWGAVVANGKAISILKAATLSVVPLEKCQRPPEEVHKLCAFSNSDQILGGDSGGPFVIDSHLHGVTSSYWANRTDGPCVFTRVNHYRDWIREVAGI